MEDYFEKQIRNALKCVEEDIKNHRSAWWYNADDVWDAAFMNLKGRTAAEQEALQEEFTLRSAALYK